MSAADSTSKSQFGWTEVSTETTREGYNKGRATLKYVDKGSAREEDDGTYGDAHAIVTASWHHEAPRPYHTDEIHFEEDADQRDENNNRQGRLVTPGVDKSTLVGVGSTKKGRFAAARGVGIMANLVEEKSGLTPAPSTNLSPQSAPMVEKLTGEPQKVTNDIGFKYTPDNVLFPGGGRPERTSETVLDVRVGTETKVNRFVSDDEVRAGGQRLRETMRARRVPRNGVIPEGLPHGPDFQDSLFPEPGGKSAAEHRISTDLANAAELDRPTRIESEIAARRDRGWRPAF